MTDKMYKAEIPANITIITDGLSREEAEKQIEELVKHFRNTSYFKNLTIDINLFQPKYEVTEFEPF